MKYNHSWKGNRCMVCAIRRQTIRGVTYFTPREDAKSQTTVRPSCLSRDMFTVIPKRESKKKKISDRDAIFEAEVIIQELIDHYGYYSGPYDPVWSSIDKARKFLKRNEA